MSDLQPEPGTSRCARCGAPMTCRPEGDCWCMELPQHLPVPDEPAGCFCPRCLAEAMGEPER